MTRTAVTARIDARVLDQRIDLQRRVAGQDALGDASGAWETVATVWAQRQPLRGRELFAAGQTHAQAEVRFVIRYRVDVLSTWRVLWNSVPHDIVAPPMDVDSQGQWLELMCNTGVREAVA